MPHHRESLQDAGHVIVCRASGGWWHRGRTETPRVLGDLRWL